MIRDREPKSALAQGSEKGSSRLRPADRRRRDLAREVRRLGVEDLLHRFEDAGIERAFVMHENGELTLSHPEVLEPLRAFLDLSQDFAGHEGIFIGREEGIPTLFFVFVHDTRRGLAQGGLRFTPYPNLAEVLTDGLRLAQGMTRKNALAGLWWGGGKGILPVTPSLDGPEIRREGSPERRRLFEAYGRFVASLGGLYYTAEDVGTQTSDMDAMLAWNRFTTCVSGHLGGSGNPSHFTARGVLRGMQAAWRFLTGSDGLRGVRVAVQGVGNVGASLVELLDDAGARVWCTDVDGEALAALKTRLPRIEVVAPEEIFDLAAEILAPCARGDQINARTIPRLGVRLICGAANNILGEPADAERLERRGITFVPDYLVNRMGITNCADEWQGYLAEDVELAAERVYPDTLRVLRHARDLRITSIQAADELADLAAAELHPIMGHRGRRIADHLLASGWHAAGGSGARRRAARRPGRRAPLVPTLDEAPVRLRWEREGRFRGDGPAIAAAPVPAASRPHLASFLSALLMDVRARALEEADGRRRRRIAGSDHGGLGLQLAVERALPHDRDELGRPEFVEHCRDLYGRNDAAIREQLHQMGIGFDPPCWLDPMGREGARVVRRLFFALEGAGLLFQARRLTFHCPRCSTVRVASDTRPVADGVRRCERCGTIVDPLLSEQLFVDLEKARPAFEEALRSGAVRFAGPSWKRRVEEILESLGPLCISRQQWWGNELPRSPGETLSTWFSLIAWSLLAAGWPAEARPEPVEEVFADPELLRRWVVPSQLVSLALTGRPVFRRIHVHGALHLVSRRLEPVADGDPGAADEERFVLRTARPLLRKQPGGWVEPATLIRRFGADALRLGLLLCLAAGSDEGITLSESRLRRARRSLARLGGKLGGLHKLAQHAPAAGRPGVADRWVVSRWAAAAAAGRYALATGRAGAAAEELVAAVEALALYARVVAARGRESGDLGAVPAALEALLGHLQAFAPLCPYTCQRLAAWWKERGLPAAAAPAPEPWWVKLIEELAARGRGPLEVSSPDARLRAELEAGRRELEALARASLSVPETPSAGRARVIGPCVVVRPGDLELPPAGGAAADWYRGLHG